MDLYKCFFSIIIICIDNNKWLFDNIFAYQNCLSCSPRFASVRRFLDAFRKVIQLLISICEFYIQSIANSFDTFSDCIMERVFDIFTDDKYYFIESGLDRIMDRIIHNDLPIRPYWFQLFNSTTKTRTHSRGHDD